MRITLDGGTTNTRLVLFDGNTIVDRFRIQAGARDNVFTGSDVPLTEKLRLAIQELLHKHGLKEGDIDCIIASGMIGSEAGLCDIPHIPVPAGIAELHRGIVQKTISEITQIPFFFIPGVKTFTDVTDLAMMDIMRGEETELMGILAAMGITTACIAIMPGSHTKIVDMDAVGRITGFRTALTGELIRAAAENTILRQSLQGAFPKTIHPAGLRDGADYAKVHGISEALFKIRIQSKFITEDTAYLYSFCIGAVMENEIASIAVQANGRPVCVGGSEPYRSAYALLLAENGIPVSVIPDEIAESAAAVGAVRILDYKEEHS